MGHAYESCSNNSLPDILMYAGDTTPWKVAITGSDGTPYQTSSLAGAVTKLAFMPYAVTSGIGSYASVVQPTLSITGEITSDPNGAAYAVFEFSHSDTINMRGKYIYQISINKSGDVRVCQGFITIRYNIDRFTSNS